jgi:hypothetical protein
LHTCDCVHCPGWQFRDVSLPRTALKKRSAIFCCTITRLYNVKHLQERAELIKLSYPGAASTRVRNHHASFNLERSTCFREKRPSAFYSTFLQLVSVTKSSFGLNSPTRKVPQKKLNPGTRTSRTCHVSTESMASALQHAQFGAILEISSVWDKNTQFMIDNLQSEGGLPSRPAVQVLHVLRTFCWL